VRILPFLGGWFQVSRYQFYSQRCKQLKNIKRICFVNCKDRNHSLRIFEINRSKGTKLFFCSAKSQIWSFTRISFILSENSRKLIPTVLCSFSWKTLSINKEIRQIFPTKDSSIVPIGQWKVWEIKSIDVRMKNEKMKSKMERTKTLERERKRKRKDCVWGAIGKRPKVYLGWLRIKWNTGLKIIEKH
jgi:hypothetical protein